MVEPAIETVSFGRSAHDSHFGFLGRNQISLPDHPEVCRLLVERTSNLERIAVRVTRQ
jgi:hypothetical protein